MAHYRQLEVMSLLKLGLIGSIQIGCIVKVARIVNNIYIIRGKWTKTLADYKQKEVIIIIFELV